MPYSGNMGRFLHRYSYSNQKNVLEQKKKKKEEKRKRDEEARPKEGRGRAEEEARPKEGRGRAEEEQKRKDGTSRCCSTQKQEEPRVCRPSFAAITESKQILFKHGITISLNDRNLTECKKRRRGWLKNNHPDKGGDVDICKEVNSAFDAIFKG